jgi:hypothetical protein
VEQARQDLAELLARAETECSVTVLRPFLEEVAAALLETLAPDGTRITLMEEGRPVAWAVAEAVAAVLKEVAVTADSLAVEAVAVADISIRPMVHMVRAVAEAVAGTAPVSF